MKSLKVLAPVAALTLLASIAGCSRSPDTKGAKSPSPVAPTAAKPASAPVEVDGTTPLPSPLPWVAAKVNGREIATARVVVIAENSLKNGAVKGKILAYRQAMNQLIVREVILEDALDKRIAPDEGQVQRAYDEARVPYKDEKAWLDYLKSQGFTDATFRAEIRATQTVNVRLGMEAEKAPPVADVETRAFYEQNPSLFDPGERLKAAHILLRLPEGATPQQRAETKARAAEVLGRLKNGEDFAKLAKQYSGDPSNAAKGGVLDEFGRGQMVDAFEVAAYALKPGELSDVVETPFGFHIIKLIERTPGQKLSYEEAVGRIKQVLAQQKRQETIQALVNRLRAKAKIETFL